MVLAVVSYDYKIWWLMTEDTNKNVWRRRLRTMTNVADDNDDYDVKLIKLQYVSMVTCNQATIPWFYHAALSCWTQI